MLILVVLWSLLILRSLPLVILKNTFFSSRRIANNLMFYGAGLKSNDLGVDPYLSFTISAIVELLGLVMGHMVLDRFGRKKPYGISLFLSGVSCLSIIFISKKIASSCLTYYEICFLI